MDKDIRSETIRINRPVYVNTGVIAAVPAFLLCAVTLMMLILDILLPSMSVNQYMIYPAAIRMITLAGILCMAVCFGDELENDRIHIDLKDVFFILFAACMLISTAVNGITHNAVFGVAYRYVGVYDLMIYIFAYMYCAGRVWKNGLKNVFFCTFMLTSDLISAAFFFNCATGNIAAFNDKLEPAAIFFHGNHYGYFMVMAAAVSAACFIHYEGKTHVLGAASLVISLGALALNRSMGCIIAAGTVFAVMLVSSLIRGGGVKRRALIMSAALVITSAAALLMVRSLRNDIMQTAAEFMQIIGGDNNIYAGNGRWGIWQYVAEYIKAYPWLGYGCEGIAEIMRDYTLTTSPHNEPLTYAAFFGIPASVFYCLGVMTAFIKGMKAGKEETENIIAAYTVLAYFVSSLFGLAVFYTVPFMFLFMGISCGCDTISNLNK